MKVKHLFSWIFPLLLGSFIGLVLVACGVKGKPQPPLEPPPLGRGEPVFSDATQDIQLKKRAPIKIKDDWKDDWNDSKDFDSDVPERSR